MHIRPSAGWFVLLVVILSCEFAIGETPRIEDVQQSNSALFRDILLALDLSTSEAHITSHLKSNNVSSALRVAKNTYELLSRERGADYSLTLMFGQIVEDLERVNSWDAARQIAYCDLHRERCDLESTDSTTFDAEAAARILPKHLSILNDTIGKDSLSYITTLTLLATTDGIQRNFESMRDRFAEAVPLIEKHLGKQGSAYANAIEGLGMAHLKLGSLPEAEKLLETSLAVHEQAWGKQSGAYVGALINLSTLRLKQRRLDDAESSAKQAMELSSGFGGGHAAMHGSCHRQLGETYLALKRFAEADLCFTKAITSFEADAVSLRDALEETYALRAKSLRNLDRSDEAAVYQAKADSLRRPGRKRSDSTFPPK